MNTREKLLASIEDARNELIVAIERMRVMEGITAAYPQETFDRGCKVNRVRGRLEGLREALAILDSKK